MKVISIVIFIGALLMYASDAILTSFWDIYLRDKMIEVSHRDPSERDILIWKTIIKEYDCTTALGVSVAFGKVIRGESSNDYEAYLRYLYAQLGHEEALEQSGCKDQAADPQNIEEQRRHHEFMMDENWENLNRIILEKIEQIREQSRKNKST